MREYYGDILWRAVKNLPGLYSHTYETWAFALLGLVLSAAIHWLRTKDRRGGWRAAVKAIAFKDVGASVVIGVLVMLCIAFLYNVVRSAYERDAEKTVAIANLKAVSVPRLDGEILQAQLIHEPQFQPVLVLWVRIRNNGTPSIVDGYSLVFTLRDRDIKSEWLEMDAVDLSARSDPKERYLFDRRHALNHKTAETPIPTGGAVTGILVAELVPAGRREVIRTDDVRLRLCYRDVRRTRHCTETVKPEDVERLHGLPGIVSPSPR